MPDRSQHKIRRRASAYLGPQDPARELDLHGSELAQRAAGADMRQEFELGDVRAESSGGRRLRMQVALQIRALILVVNELVKYDKLKAVL